MYILQYKIIVIEDHFFYKFQKNYNFNEVTMMEYKIAIFIFQSNATVQGTHQQ